MESFQYIRTTRELIYRECSGRHTTLEKGVPGFILDENRINNIFDITEKQKKDCLQQLDDANNFDRTLALVQGRVCSLTDSDFYRCDKPKSYPVPGEIF
jgi:hypothetical protein